MEEQKLEIIMAKYLEGRTTEQESLVILDYLMESDRNRSMFELASSAYFSMIQNFNNKND